MRCAAQAVCAALVWSTVCVLESKRVKVRVVRVEQGVCGMLVSWCRSNMSGVGASANSKLKCAAVRLCLAVHVLRCHVHARSVQFHELHSVG